MMMGQARERREHEQAECKRVQSRPGSGPSAEQLLRAEARAQEMLQRQADLRLAPAVLLEERRRRQLALAQQVMY